MDGLVLATFPQSTTWASLPPVSFGLCRRWVSRGQVRKCQVAPMRMPTARVLCCDGKRLWQVAGLLGAVDLWLRAWTCG